MVASNPQIDDPATELERLLEESRARLHESEQLLESWQEWENVFPSQPDRGELRQRTRDFLKKTGA